MGSVELFVGLGEELLAHREHGLLVGRVGQLVYLAVSRAVGEVTVIAPDLLDCRVLEELFELVADAAHVLDEPFHRRRWVCQGLEIALAPHRRQLEQLDFVLDQLTHFYRFKDRVVSCC